MTAERMILPLLNRSLTGSVIILMVMILRLFAGRMPKRYLCILWMIPFLRLLFSVSIPASFSLLPVNPEPIVEVSVEGGRIPVLNTGIETIDRTVNLVLAGRMAPDMTTSADPVQIYLAVFSILWAAGAAAFLLINGFRYRRLRRDLADAVPGEPGVYYSDWLSMPMVLGILRARVYLPSMFLREEYAEEKQFVLEHELAHKRRYDHVVKLMAFAALTMHWFNPLVWAAYSMLCRDMEMACDESVLGRLGEEQKKGYSMALLKFQARRSALLIPLAFGESHTRSRIRNILNYRKPGFWIHAAAIVLLAIAARTLLVDPAGGESAQAVIGGADGPTSIFLAGKPGGEADADSSVSVIGGADGPASTFLAGKLDGDADSSVSIIGGADGPTSIFLAGKSGGEGGEPAENLDVETVKTRSYGTGVELDDVHAGRISMHGYFGYLVFALDSGADGQGEAKLLSAVTLSEAGGISMQGDGYTEIVAGDGGAMVIPDAYNPDVTRKQVYLYYEDDNRIERLDDAVGEEIGRMLTESFGAGAGAGMTDAKIEEEFLADLLTAVREEYGGESGVLYGPVIVPETDSNIYGFLAADGENVENIWYGLWNADLGTLRRIPLFPAEQ